MSRMGTWMMGGPMIALASLIWLTGRGLAWNDAAQLMEIQKIAEIIHADKQRSERMAAALANRVEFIDDIMYGFKPRKRGGFGVGKKLGVIVPDGIELKIMQIQRGGIINPVLAKDAEALEEMARRIGAIGKVIRHYKNPNFGKGKKTKKEWIEHSERMVEGSQKLAEAVKVQNAETVQLAARMIHDACNACHAVFRE